MKSIFAILLIPSFSHAAWPINCQLHLLGQIAAYQDSNFKEFSEGRKSLKHLASVVFEEGKIRLKGKSADGKSCSATVTYKTVGPIPEGCPDYAVSKVTSDCK